MFIKLTISLLTSRGYITMVYKTFYIDLVSSKMFSDLLYRQKHGSRAKELVKTTFKAKYCKYCGLKLDKKVETGNICLECYEPIKVTKNNIKQRKCLSCLDMFKSYHIGNRICPACKKISKFKESSLDDQCTATIQGLLE